MWIFIIVIGIFFSTIAGAMAYVITYQEYAHHFPNKRTAIKLSLQTSFFAFFFFLLLSCLAAFLLKTFL